MQKCEETTLFFSASVDWKLVGTVTTLSPSRHILMAELNGKTPRGPVYWGREFLGWHVGPLYFMTTDLVQLIGAHAAMEVGIVMLSHLLRLYVRLLR